MSDPIVGTRLKLTRAQENLDALRHEINTFMRGDPEDVNSRGGIDLHFNGPKGEWIGTAHIPRPPPPEWGLLIGECLHNIRSGLDHLAWQLVKVRGGTPTKRTEFPIFDSESEFKERARKKIAGMATGARTEIKKLQPFNGGERNNLWLLHSLNILDKHRVLTLAGFHVGHIDVGIEFPTYVLVTKRYAMEPGPLEDGTVVFDIRWDGSTLPPNAEMDMDLDLAFDVAFDKGGPLPLETNPAEGKHVIQLLTTILEHVTDAVIPTLQPFLP
jgi:hypothetical protein